MLVSVVESLLVRTLAAFERGERARGDVEARRSHADPVHDPQARPDPVLDPNLATGVDPEGLLAPQHVLQPLADETGIQEEVALRHGRVAIEQGGHGTSRPASS